MGGRIESAASVGRYDQVYVSPHFDDAGFSCAAALLNARDAGSRSLVACLFTGGPSGDPADPARLAEEAAAADRGGFDFVTAGFPDAPFRGPEHRDFNGLVWGDGPRDPDLVGALSAWLGDVISRAGPRELLAPLGVGRHIDHRLAFEASRRAAEACKVPVWFYEDRPYAFVDQAAEVRLRELGCDVPVSADRFFRSFWKAPYVEAHLRERRDRMACRACYEKSIPGAAALLAPVPRLTTREDPDSVWAVVSAYASQIADFLDGRAGFESACAECGRRFQTRSPCAERSWSLGTPAGAASRPGTAPA